MSTVWVGIGLLFIAGLVLLMMRSRNPANNTVYAPTHAPAPAPVGAAPGCDGVQVRRHTVSVPAGVAIDPGGIGKGLAADLVTDLLMTAGAHGVGVVAERSCEPGDPQLLPRLRHPSAAMTSSVVATSARFGTAYSSAAFWKSSFTVDVPSDTTTTS